MLVCERGRIVALLLLGVIWLAGTGASAQGFQMFGKGVEIWGFVDNIVRDGTRGKTTGREAVGFEYRIKAGVLVVDGGNQCFVNGAPTNVGLVFLRSGAYARSFTCDPE